MSAAHPVLRGLVAVRAESGLTAIALAEKARLPVRQLRDWESGRSEPPLHLLAGWWAPALDRIVVIDAVPAKLTALHRHPRVHPVIYLISQIRDHRGLSQKELSVAAGLSREAVSRLENGHSQPRFATAALLLDTLGCPMRLHVPGTQNPGAVPLDRTARTTAQKRTTSL